MEKDVEKKRKKEIFHTIFEPLPTTRIMIVEMDLAIRNRHRILANYPETTTATENNNNNPINMKPRPQQSINNHSKFIKYVREMVRNNIYIKYTAGKTSLQVHDQNKYKILMREHMDHKTEFHTYTPKREKLTASS